jgi:uncharacterized membrane protein
MKRWQKTLIFLIGMGFFVLIDQVIILAVTTWSSQLKDVCDASCSSTPGAVFWLQIVGLVIMSICGLMWIVLPDEEAR